MTLRIRISIFVFFGGMLLAFGVLFGDFDRITLLENRIDALTLESQVSAWESASTQATSALSDKVDQLPGLSDLAKAVGDKSIGAIQQIVAPLEMGNTVARVDVLDADGNMIYSSDPDLNAEPLLDAGLVYKLQAESGTRTGLQADQHGNILITYARVLSVGSDQVGLLVLADRPNLLASLIKTATGSDIVLLDPRGQAKSSYVEPQLLPALLATIGTPKTGVSLAHVADHVYRLGVTVISSGAGNRIGYEMAMSDVSQSYQHDRSRQIFAYFVIIGAIVAIQVALFLYLSRTFRPLSDSIAALNALTAGDTSVYIIGEDRQDEVGRLAKLTHIVRDLKRDDIRGEQVRQRQHQRQERFIRNEMIALAGALNEEARTELLADLDKIEAMVRRDGASAAATSEEMADVAGTLGSLAVAFRYMSERVRAQYQSLDKLVADLRDALATKTELIGLQQQFQIADQMRAAILPKTLPPRKDVEIEGRLLPAAEFGGSFYDFFLLDETHLFIVAAEVSGRDMGATSLTIVVRTLLKVMASLGMSPADAMKRVNAMVLAENDRRLAVRALVGILDLGTGQLSYCCAGYPTPFILRRLGEAAALPIGDSGPIGIVEPASLSEGSIELPPRTTMVWVSSGTIGAPDPLDRPFGRDGVIEALQAGDNLEARSVCNGVIAAITSHEHGRKRSEDATVIAIRYLGSR